MPGSFDCGICDEILGNAVKNRVHRILKNNCIILKYTAFFVNWIRDHNMLVFVLCVFYLLDSEGD